MSTLISRLYNWVTDKANSVKITASRHDAELDQIITALNRKVLIAASAPSNPINGQTWVDSANNLVKCYLNNTWVIISGTFLISATEPDSPEEGWIWYDTTNNLLKTYNGATWDQAGNMIFPASTAQGDLVYLSAASTLARLAKSTDASRVLANTGTDNNPAWAQVNTAMLKTTTGEVSTSGANTQTLTLPGGEYGFYPQVKGSSTSVGAEVSIFGCSGQVALTTSYATYASTYGADTVGTVYIKQRYVTASGTDDWLFLLVDKTSLDIVSAWYAKDAPHYGNGGEYADMPHPFPGYDKEKFIVCLADKESIERVKAEVTRKRSILTIVNEDYDVGTEDLPFEPLHSGKYLTEDKDGKQMQVKEMVTELSEEIKVRKLIKKK